MRATVPDCWNSIAKVGVAASNAIAAKRLRPIMSAPVAISPDSIVPQGAEASINPARPRGLAAGTRSPCPWEIDPAVLSHLGDEGVHQRASSRLGIDGGEMGFRQHVAHDLRRLARIDQIIDHQHAFAAVGAGDDAVDALEDLQFPWPV